MKNESNRLQENVNRIYAGFSGIPESTAAFNLSEDKWSLKEIFGHLVDSAANNYQRFIRLQETDQLEFPGYQYDWIKIVPYGTYPYQQILELWKQLNLLISHIVENIDDSCQKNRWLIDGRQLTLEFLVKDYNDHLEHHLDQLENRLEEVKSAVGRTLYRVVKKYDEAPDNPVKLTAGRTVTIVEASDPTGDWPNWLFCRWEDKEGWVPMQIIDRSGKSGSVCEDYDATEFSLTPGQVILAEKELNGWVWGTKEGESDKYGWAPLNCLERIGNDGN